VYRSHNRQSDAFAAVYSGIGRRHRAVVVSIRHFAGVAVAASVAAAAAQRQQAAARASSPQQEHETL
jgi:hypothetical protein